MADENSQLQLVTFQLGEELYGVDIMDVKEIVKVQTVRPIPNAPYYVEGIINLRAEIIPIINLHKRFHLKAIEKKLEDDLDDEGGFIILDIEGNKIGIIIDRVARVITVDRGEIKPPPQMLCGIGTEYIEGVVRQDASYLIILDTRKIFNAGELQKIIDPQL
ncbi:MAG: chemotaxis protein CheW [Treponema sp.]|nr:chemotaxis protein CheW [Treponema sp.]